MHTPEPWRAARAHEGADGPYWDIEPEERAEYDAKPYTTIYGGNGMVVTNAHDLFTFRPGDAERIVACVNACEGIENPEAVRDAIAVMAKMPQPGDFQFLGKTEWADETLRWLDESVRPVLARLGEP